MVDGTMILHSGGNDVSIEELKEVPVPEPTRSWHPIGHHRLVRAVKNSLDGNFYNIREERHGIKGDRGQQYFGVLHLENKINEDMGLSIGLRNSTDRSLSAGVVFGEQVFVCDNLILSGSEFVLQRKHTTFLNLAEVVSNGLNRFLAQTETLGRGIDRLKDTPLSDGAAKQHVFDVFNAGALPLHLFDDVARLYMQPKPGHLDCQPRSLWGLVNACTRAIQVLRPQAQFNASLNTGRHFQLVSA